MMIKTWTVCVALAAGAVVGVRLHAGAAPQNNAQATAPADATRVALDADDIGGVVRSSAGPEAGVWVIAETNDLPTKFRRIVVTDDRGRYVLPDLPAATYDVWVRGYGLVDSAHVRATPGQQLALSAVTAPNAVAAAQAYPANYWYSLMQVPPKGAFPMTIPGASNGRGSFDPETGGGGGAQVIKTQAEWVNLLKCSACHQMGTKATRELNKNLGHFDSSIKAWDRALRSGQTGANTGQFGTSTIDRVNRFGHERGLAMFADWSDRIAAGEVPQAPPRPQGVERNLVVTLWDFSTPVAFVHDAISTDKRNPTVNAYGPIYGTEWSQDTIVTVDPIKHVKGEMKVPLKDESDRKKLPTWSPQAMEAPSPVWGDELIWNDPINPHSVMMDGKGRAWFIAVTHPADKQPAYCKAGSNNPFAKNSPIPENTRGLDVYDPKTGKITTFNTCFSSSHQTFAEDKDDTIFFSFRSGPTGIGWVKTKMLLETGDEEKAQGWCPPIIDYNGDGKVGAYTQAPEPPEPTLDRVVSGRGYGVAWSPLDGSAWYVVPGTPGQIVRIQIGANPPATCVTEVYEPPYNNPKAPGMWASNPRGIDIDRNGIVWTALSDSNHLASFDRRKCKVMRGPTATGQHCPEGWTLYSAPGPKFKGVTDELGTDFFYYNWVDQFDVLGLGKNTPIATGTWSDSLLALDPATKKWTTLRVPYPLGFYTREVDGRIDDPKAGWKGRGLWAANETRVTWLGEGGKGTTSYVAHFQLRPDPLAK